MEDPEIFQSDLIVQRDMTVRLRRKLDRAVREFLEEETGIEPFTSMVISEGPGATSYEQSWRYPTITLPGINISVKVVDRSDGQ